MMGNQAAAGGASTGDAENPGGFQHVPALDGVRGTAILMVLINHLLWSNSSTGSRFFDGIEMVRGSLGTGVNLFFALSGFLITGILIDTLQTPHYFRTFYARRSLRIFPLYYGVLLFLLAVTPAMHLQWNGWQYYFLTYTRNIAVWRLFVPMNLGHFNISHFWSLQVEEQFYLVWPFLVWRLRTPRAIVRASLWGCGLVLVVRIVCQYLRVTGHPAFQTEYLEFYPTFSCADQLLFGCCLAALCRTRLRSRVLALAPWIFFAAFVVLTPAFVVLDGFHLTSTAHPVLIDVFVTVGISILGIGSAAVVAMALRTGSWVQSMLQWRGLRTLGRYSYGLYVYHYSLDGFLTAPLRAWIFGFTGSKGAAVVGGAVIVGGLSMAVAVLSYWAFESRFLRMKRRFSYNAAPPRPVGGS